jgi:ubiquinone/menaquinone biosynthesis C-methylase UbiE
VSSNDRPAASFEVAAQAYGAFMGRYSRPLAVLFLQLLQLPQEARVLDVGCGTGALTQRLVERVGTANVVACDPSESFVDAMRHDFPDLRVEHAGAEELPFQDAHFDATLAQLVVHFMTDPARGLSEMARVTAPGGVVAASVWDHSANAGPLSLYWSAVRDVHADVLDETGMAGVQPGDLAHRFDVAGMSQAQTTTLTVAVEHPTFEDWWHPYTLGVGTAGAHYAAQPPEEQARIQQRCRELLPSEPFSITADAWTTWWRKPAPSGG